MSYTVIKYTSEHHHVWDDFVAKSKNGTFLFSRGFMEYHAERFKDFSLMVFDKQKLIAVMPANIQQNTVYSHQGLTYGGLVYNERLKQAVVIKVFQVLLCFLHNNNVILLNLKITPIIYHKFPSQELEYTLFLAEARLTRRDSMAVIDLQNRIKIAPNRMEGIKKGIANNFEIAEQADFTEFWNTVLIPNLKKKHNAVPVHSLDEIMHLKLLFPKNIKLYTISQHNQIVAGTVIFETNNVAHSQYISVDDNKNESGSLDYLYYHLITETYKNIHYFDFGISNEQQGRKLNEGLSFWKESYGARAIVQDFYEIDTKNYILLDNILI